MCLGSQITLECSILENRTVATVFRGSAFNCSESHDEIILLHTEENPTKSCNDGLIFGYTKPRINGDWLHTTVLNVNLTSDIIGSTITCSNDDGSTEKEIGNYTVIQNCADTDSTTGIATNNLFGNIIYKVINCRKLCHFNISYKWQHIK